MNKRQAERIHAKKRALERYNLSFTKAVRRQIKGKITNNLGTFLYRQSRRVTIWEVEHDNKKYKVVYDKLRGEIVTFLPYEEENQEAQESKSGTVAVGDSSQEGMDELVLRVGCITHGNGSVPPGKEVA